MFLENYLKKFDLRLFEANQENYQIFIKVTEKFNIGENKRIEKIGKYLRRGWKKKKKKSTFRAFASRAYKQ